MIGNWCPKASHAEVCSISSLFFAVFMYDVDPETWLIENHLNNMSKKQKIEAHLLQFCETKTKSMGKRESEETLNFGFEILYFILMTVCYIF